MPTPRRIESQSRDKLLLCNTLTHTLKRARFYGRTTDIDEKVTAIVKRRYELLSQGREFASDGTLRVVSNQIGC